MVGVVETASKIGQSRRQNKQAGDKRKRADLGEDEDEDE